MDIIREGRVGGWRRDELLAYIAQVADKLTLEFNADVRLSVEKVVSSFKPLLARGLQLRNHTLVE